MVLFMFAVACLFPAYAGVIPFTRSLGSCLESFPRLRGGDPQTPATEHSRTNFSPPTRG